MTKKFLFVLALMLIASPVIFAQTVIADTNPTAQAHAQWMAIAGGFSMAIASSLCGLAQGKAIAAAVEGIARNPGAANAIRLAMLIGVAFIESLALFTLVIIVLKVQ